MKNDQFKMKISRIQHHGAPVSDPAQGERISQHAGSETGVPAWRGFLILILLLIVIAEGIKIMIKSKI